MTIESKIEALSTLIYANNLDEFISQFDLEPSAFYQFNSEDQTLLHIAAKTANSTGFIKFLLEQGYDINTKDIDQSTPVFEAVNYRCVENLKYLLESQSVVELETVTVDNNTPLNNACASGYLDCIELLLLHGADIESKVSGTSPLRDAVFFSGDHEVINYLINHGADVNGNESSIPILAAVSREDLSTLKFLISKGADPHKKNKKGLNALIFAKRVGNQDILDYLTGLDQ